MASVLLLLIDMDENSLRYLLLTPDAWEMTRLDALHGDGSLVLFGDPELDWLLELAEQALPLEAELVPRASISRLYVVRYTRDY
jgi:hypothetical protein